jgi:hypothetical protein
LFGIIENVCDRCFVAKNIWESVPYLSVKRAFNKEVLFIFNTALIACLASSLRPRDLVFPKSTRLNGQRETCAPQSQNDMLDVCGDKGIQVAGAWMVVYDPSAIACIGDGYLIGYASWICHSPK